MTVASTAAAQSSADSGFKLLVAAPILLHEIGQILSTYPLISFVLMAAFGALAAHLIDVEKEAGALRDFKSFAARLFVTEFACVCLWFAWDYMKWDLAPGLIACGIVSIWPKQILEHALSVMKRVIDSVVNAKTGGKP